VILDAQGRALVMCDHQVEVKSSMLIYDISKLDFISDNNGFAVFKCKQCHFTIEIDHRERSSTENH
jgi:hypothetical protein